MFSKMQHDIWLRTPECLVNSRKFDLALRATPVEALKEKLREKLPSLNTNILLLHLTPEEILSSTTSGNLWAKLLHQILLESNANREYTKKSTDMLSQAMTLASVNIQLQHLHNISPDSTLELLSDLPSFQEWNDDSSASDTLLRNLAAIEEEVSILVEKMGQLDHRLRSKYVRRDEKTLKHLTSHSLRSLQVRFVWNKYTVMVHYQGEWWALPRDYTLLIHNKLADTISSLLLVKCATGVCYEPTAYNTARHLLQYLTELAVTHPNYFEIAKALEGLVTSEVLATEEHWENRQLLISIANELQVCHYEYHDSQLQHILKSASTPFKHELAGMVKLLGHPIINVAATAHHAQDRACAPLNINYCSIQSTRNHAVESFVRNYILKHGKWPPTRILDGAPQILVESRALNKDPYSRSMTKKFGIPSTQDFVYIELDQILELDKLTHYSQYLKDKALSVLRDDAVRYYISKTLTHLDWKEGRLLLVHLLHSEDELDLAGYLDQYMTSDLSFSEILNYLVIKLVPKEKELKTVARPFGCKTYQDRFRSCLQEENVKNFLDQYVEDQSMTLDNLGIIRRMYTFRNLKNTYKNWRVLYINFDVSGWCGNFRHETVEPIAHDVLDRVFGTRKFFSKTQIAYEKSFFYLPDAQGVYHWTGQEGGIEGLNQYTWMAVYIPQMRHALSEFGLHFHVMAYGDDYKAALLVPPEQAHIDLGILKSRIVEVVAHSARTEFGQKMKYYDSYGSEAYISFCKNASVHGVEMPQGIRKIQKCYGATNAFLPTLDDYISSAFSNAHSAARTMPCHYPAYKVALIWSYYHLKRHFIYDGASDSILHGSMLTPSCVGGLPILFLNTFHTRAESDHLPNYLALLDSVMKLDRDIGERMSQGLTFDVLDPEERIALLRDPYSLPIQKPPLPSGIFRREILPALRPMIRNREVLDLIEAAEDSWSEQFHRALLLSRPLMPRVLASIYACTPSALIEEIMRRFETASSIKDILILRRGQRVTEQVLRKVVRAEIKLQTWRVMRIKQGDGPAERWSPDVCPTQFADSLRSYWGAEVIGVTMPPVEHLVTIATPAVAALDPRAISNHFSYQTSTPEVVLQGGPTVHWALGDAEPFLGFRTRLGAELPTIKILEDNPFLSKIKTLLDVVSWVSKGAVGPDGRIMQSNLPDLIYILLEHYYRGDPHELLPFGAKRKSGTIQHHWRSPHYREHIMPNSLYNTWTWVSGESNTHQHLRGTTHHHTLNFLQLYCGIVSVIQCKLQYSAKITTGQRFWGITTECTYCMRPIEEPPIRVDPDRFPSTRPSLLKHLELTQYSCKALREAAHEMASKSARNIDLTGVVSVEMAASGIIQKLMDQMCMTSKRLADWVGGPALTASKIDTLETWVPGGVSCIVREREIRHLPITVLADALLLYIYHRTFLLGRRSQLRTLLQRIWISNPAALPWYPALDFIKQAGVLTHLVLEVEKLTGIKPPVCYSNAKSASRYLGEAALYKGMQMGYTRNFAWLSYYEDDHVEAELLNFEKHIKYHIIWRSLRPLGRVAKRRKDTEGLHQVVSAVMLVATLLPRDAESIKDAISGSQTNTADISLFIDGICGQEEFEEALDDESHIIHEVIEMLVSTDLITAETVPDYDRLLQDSDQVHLLVNAELQKYDHMHVFLGTLADCINMVRGLDPDDYLTLHIPAPPRPSKDVLVPVQDIRHIDGGAFWVQGEQTREVFPVDRSQTTCFWPTNEIVTTPHHLWRPFGRGTTSINKILEIMNWLHLPISVLSGCNIMCLGEGYGGIMDGLAASTTGCHFLYNTLPESERFLTVPALALNSLRVNEHTWDSRLVNSSVYDLTLPSTREALISNDMLRYHMVICDAEVSWNAIEKYHNLIKHVAEVYLSKRTVHGILVLKVFLDTVGVVQEIITLLSNYSNYVGVYRPRGSPPGGEVYVVAYGMRREYDRHHPDTMSGAPRATRSLAKMSNQILNNLKGLLPPREVIINLTVPRQLLMFRQHMHKLPPSFSQRITGRFGIPITLKPPDLVSSKAEISAYIRELKLNTQQIRRELSTPNLLFAAEVVHVLLKYLTAQSLLIYITQIVKKGQTRLTQEIIRNQFLEEYYKVHPRVPPLPEETCFSRSIFLCGVQCSPYGVWRDGFDTALEMYSWFSIQNTR